MDTTASNPNALLPRAPGGTGAGMAVSLGVHAALLAALAGVVQWRTQTPVVAAAELWASVPEVAAAPAPVPAAPAPVPVPAPVPAPPPPAAEAPKPPDIATEQAARQRAERERQERERQAATERQRREREQRAAQQEREQAEATERARQEQLRRMMQSAGGAGGTPTGTAPRDAAPSANYIARLATLIRGNTVFSGDVGGNPAAEVEVRTAAGGAILSRRLVKSSGHAAWDDAVLRAIDRTGKLPPDTDGRVPSVLIISFRPKD